ncbi:unnamed protein product [Brassica oleracea]
MGDKEKNQYTLWNSEETKVLIELLVEGIQRAWRDSNGIMNKATVEHKILPVLNERLGCQKTHKHYLSRIKFLKGQYQCYVDLLNNSSGFGWDPIMKRFVASNEVWNDYLKGHPNHKFLRYDSSEQFDDLKIIFDCETANGSSAIGLGDTTDARVLTVGDSQVQDNLNFEDINDDVYAQQPSPENGVKRRVEKLVSRKRSRSDASSSAVEINSDQSDAMVMMTSKILTSITQREERQQKEAEKREAEKKKNMVTLIYSLGMKDVFTDMCFIMESTFEEEQQMYDEMQANQMEEDESENRIQRPIRRPITNIGYDYIQNVLKEDPEHFRSLYRMYPSSFEKFCDLIRMKAGLRDTRNICIEEMVATFLLIVGQGSKYGYTKDTFKRSKFTISENFHKVLRALNTLAPDLMVKPGVATAAKISESTRFYPYFKVQINFT